MTVKTRALAVLGLITATLWVSGCGHFNCTRTFGASTCAAGGSSTKGGGGNTTAGTYLFIADAGGIQGEVLDPNAKTISVTPNFGTVSVNTNVPGDWMAVAQQQFMYSGYTSIGQIYGWSVSGSGTLTALTGSPFPATYLRGNTSAGSQAMITNPAGTLLFALDQSTEAIDVYQIGTAGALTGPTVAQLPSGFIPFNLAIDGLGKYLYVSNLVGLQTTEVAEFSIASNGALTAAGAPVSSNLQQMQGEASGKFMLGTSGGIFGGGGSLYVASINQSTGALTATLVATAGAPVDVTVQPGTGGNLVYAFDMPGSSGNGAIEGFTLDLSTGALASIANITATGSRGEFDQTGKYLFVVASSQGVPSALDAFDVTASSALTTPLATVGWAPGAWSPFDTP